MRRISTTESGEGEGESTEQRLLSTFASKKPFNRISSTTTNKVNNWIVAKNQRWGEQAKQRRQVRKVKRQNHQSHQINTYTPTDQRILQELHDRSEQ